MEEIILPIEAGEKKEKINPEATEINIGQLLSCSQRTIKSYVDRGILPKPISHHDGIRYFSKEAVVKALGLQDLNEIIITPDEASKILKISVTRIETLVRDRVFTEVKLKGMANAKLWLIKREIEEYDVEIGEVIRALDSGRNREFIAAFFTDWSIPTMELILTKEEVDILKKALFDEMDFVAIGEVHGISGASCRYKFTKALTRLRGRIRNAVSIIDAIETKRIKKELDEEYADRFRELEEKITIVNGFISDNEKKINMDILNKMIIVPEDLTIDRERNLRNLMNTKLHNMDWSVRAMNCFKSNNLETVKDLLRIGEIQLMEFRNFGKNTLLEVKLLLHSHGLKLPIGEPSIK
jgi:DNA-binding transcriptional MerR regulator